MCFGIVDRLVNPSTKNKKRTDPDQLELKQILGKYDNFEKKKNDKTKKKAEYLNKIPESRSSLKAYSQTSTKADNDLEQSSNFDNSDYSKYLLSNVHKEEAKLLNNKKQASELMSQSMKQSSRRPYQNSTPNLSERIQTYTQEENDEGSENLNENVDFSEQEELPTFQINKGIIENLQFMKDRKEKIVDLEEENNKMLSPVESQKIGYDSNNSLNERISLNKDLKVSEYSDDEGRDIDLEEQYNQMKQEIKEDKSDDESINDVDIRYF